MATFRFVGRIFSIKNGDNTDGYMRTDYKSGWMREQMKFRVFDGTNSNIVEVNSGRWQEESKNSIYTFSKTTDGKKGEQIVVSWDQRFDKDIINNVAGFKLMTINMNTDKKNEDEKLIRHYIAESDFCDAVRKIVNNPKSKDMIFAVSGNIEYTYSASKGTYYSNYVVTRVERVTDDSSMYSNATIEVFYEDDCFDENNYEETGKAIVNGYTNFYDKDSKSTRFCPIRLALRDKAAVHVWKKLFGGTTNKVPVRCLGVRCHCINGSEREQLTYEDLEDDQKELVDFGLTTLEDINRDNNGGAYGDKIEELRIFNLSANYTKGSKDTNYTHDDLIKKPGKIEETSNGGFEDNDDFDLFDL